LTPGAAAGEDAPVKDAPDILPGLTSTKKERIPAFLADMERLGVKRIAFFPTCLKGDERSALYAELERIPGLAMPHVHITAETEEGELDYLAGRFGTEAFNIHPRRSTHPFPAIPDRYRERIFVENVDVVPEADELAASGGLCLDYSHWENGKAFRSKAYEGFDGLVARARIGCCHVSAFKRGVPNQWNGGWDHHEFASTGDLAYMADHAFRLPPRWISLELENPLPDQLEAARWLRGLLGLPG